MPCPCFMVELANERVVNAAERYDVRRVDTGEIVRRDVSYLGHDLPVGAMWWVDVLSAEADYRPSGPTDHGDCDEDELERLRGLAREQPEWYAPRGVDEPSGLPLRRPTGHFGSGPQLKVMTPGGVWCVTGRAANCGSPWDYDHRCWVVHGDPPAITVDKNGRTCSAGGGSIQVGSYHGFLREGALTDA